MTKAIRVIKVGDTLYIKDDWLDKGFSTTDNILQALDINDPNYKNLMDRLIYMYPNAKFTVEEYKVTFKKL